MKNRNIPKYLTICLMYFNTLLRDHLYTLTLCFCSKILYLNLIVLLHISVHIFTKHSHRSQFTNLNLNCIFCLRFLATVTFILDHPSFPYRGQFIEDTRAVRPAVPGILWRPSLLERAYTRMNWRQFIKFNSVASVMMENVPDFID